MQFTMISSQILQFKKRDENLYSPAIEKLGEYYFNTDGAKAIYNFDEKEIAKLKSSQRNIDSMSLQSMEEEFFKLQAFLEYKTSKYSGAAKVQRAQDIRLFGKNEEGEPKRTLTLKEREDFWALYNEYVKQHASDILGSRMSSTRIQQYLSREYQGEFDVNENVIEKIKDALEQRLDREPQVNVDEATPIFRGTRNDQSTKLSSTNFHLRLSNSNK